MKVFEILLFIACVIIAILSIATHIRISQKIAQIKIGMSYDQVRAILGEPKFSKTAEEVVTLTYSWNPARHIYLVREIVLKNNNVASITKTSLF
jgi:hypothetical protein